MSRLRVPSHESRFTVRESRATSDGPRLASDERRATGHGWRATSDERRATVGERRATVCEPRATSGFAARRASDERRGQVTVEFAVLLTFVAAGLIYMGFYAQRAQQGRMKSSADSLSAQFSALPSDFMTWNSYRESLTLMLRDVELLEDGTEVVKNDEQGTESCSSYLHALAADVNSSGSADGTELPSIGKVKPCKTDSERLRKYITAPPNTNNPNSLFGKDSLPGFEDF